MNLDAPIYDESEEESEEQKFRRNEARIRCIKGEFEQAIVERPDGKAPVFEGEAFSELCRELADIVSRRYASLCQDLAKKFPILKDPKSLGIYLGQYAAWLGYSVGWGYSGKGVIAAPEVFFNPNLGLRDSLEKLLTQARPYSEPHGHIRELCGEIQFNGRNNRMKYTLHAECRCELTPVGGANIAFDLETHQIRYEWEVRLTDLQGKDVRTGEIVRGDGN